MDEIQVLSEYENFQRIVHLSLWYDESFLCRFYCFMSLSPVSVSHLTTSLEVTCFFLHYLLAFLPNMCYKMKEQFGR